MPLPPQEPFSLPEAPRVCGQARLCICRLFLVLRELFAVFLTRCHRVKRIGEKLSVGVLARFTRLVLRIIARRRIFVRGIDNGRSLWYFGSRSMSRTVFGRYIRDFFIDELRCFFTNERRYLYGISNERTQQTLRNL